MTLALAGLALGFGTLFPQFETENAAQIPTSFGGLLFMMAAVAELTTRVLRIKSRGDRLGAERLKKEWVDDDNDWKRMRAVIAERWLRVPMGAIVYSVSGL